MAAALQLYVITLCFCACSTMPCVAVHAPLCPVLLCMLHYANAATMVTAQAAAALEDAAHGTCTYTCTHARRRLYTHPKPKRELHIVALTPAMQVTLHSHLQCA
jgi:hypothetical protein